MQELVQVVNFQQIDDETIYFKDGIQYILWSKTQKTKSVLYEFRPLVGQGYSKSMKLSDIHLIYQELFIYKKRPSSQLTSLQISLF